MIKRQAVTQRGSVKKGVYRNFAKFTGKHLCQGLTFKKVAGLLLLKRNKSRVFSVDCSQTHKIGAFCKIR